MADEPKETQNAEETPAPEPTSQPPQETAPKEPEYATKSEMKERFDKIETLLQSLQGEEETLDVTDEDSLRKLWAEQFGTSPSPSGEGGQDLQEPVTRAELMKLVAQNEQMRKEVSAYMYNSELKRLRSTYSDFQENERDILKIASQHPSLSGDEVYILYRAQKLGFDALTPKEKTQAAGAAKAVQDAKRAASEKPSASGSPTKPTSRSGAEAALQAYEEMERKFGA